MSTTKADRLLRSLIDAGLSLTEFTILAIKILEMQRNLKIDNEDRRERDRRWQKKKSREEQYIEQQLKDEEQRRIQGLNKLREFGYVVHDEIPTNSNKTDRFLLPFSNEINNLRQKQRDCCLTFNIDYDLRRNQQTLERACRRAKRNIYELRAERFNHPEFRSVLSVETITLHSKLKEAIREINRIFSESKSDQDKRYLQELVNYINQYEGDIDLLMCQMQYEPKVKETILFSPVTTDILDRMNLILHQVRTLAKQISTDDHLDDQLDEETSPESSSIPNKATYIIKIQTNNQISSSLSDDANVSIKLYGTYNKSPDVRLIQSINKTKWQSGQMDLFNVELNYLGDLYAIELWHDSQYSSWKVDWIEIIDDAANIYRFPLDRLLDKYSEEKKTRFIIQRDIGPVNRLPTKPAKEIKPYKQIGFSTYTVQVKTRKQPNKVTDSKVFMQLKGENGHFSDQLCSANSAFKSSVFEPDQLDTFYLVWPYLAKINSLHLIVQSDGIQPPWFCEYITVEDGQTGDKYKFVVNQLFDETDPNSKRNLTVYPENTNQKEEKEDKAKPGYLMKIKTGEKGLSNMSTAPSINLTLKGEKEKSGAYTLKPLDNQRKLFQENQTDQFIIPSKYYIGPIKSLQLSSNNPLDKWFIENIIMRDVAQGKDYIFPVYKWFSAADGSNNLTVQPINERKADYKVYTRTIASDLQGPDRSIKLLLQGTKGKQEVELNNPITMSNTFQPGRKDEYYLENLKSLGDLQSLQVDVTHPNIKKLGLDYIEIKDLTTNDAYRFNINRMLDSKNPKMVAKAELIPRSKVNPNQSTLLNTTSAVSNRPNFDQVTTNVPQGAKRLNDKMKASIRVDDEFEEDHSKVDRNEEKNEISEQSSVEDTYQTNIKAKNEEYFDENGRSSANLRKGKTDAYTVDTPKDYRKLKNVLIESKKKDIYQSESREVHSEDEHSKEDDMKNKSISTLENSSKTNQNREKNEFSDQSSVEESHRMKTKNLLDKNAKSRAELADENGRENNLRKDYEELKHTKASLIEVKKKDLHQSESREIHNTKTDRVEYSKDDYLDSEKNRFESTKSSKPYSDSHLRERTQPQDAKRFHEKMNEPIKRDNDFGEDHSEEIDVGNKSISTTENSSKINRNKEINEFSDQSSVEDNHRIKIKKLLDKDAKSQFELIGQDGRENTLRKENNDTYTVRTPTDFEELKNVKSSSNESKKNDLYQPESREVHSNKINRAELTNDDRANSEKNLFSPSKSIKANDDFEEDRSKEIDVENRSISTTEKSSKINQNREKKEFSDQSSVEEDHQMKMKRRLDKDAKSRGELADENGRSIANQRENYLRNGKIETYTADTSKDYGEVSSIEPNKKDRYQSESHEISSNKINRSKPYSDANLREQIRTPGTSSLPTTIRKLPDSEKTDKTLSDNDEDNVSLTNQTPISSTSENLSKKTNSSLEKLSTREVHRDDRIKNDSKRALVDHQVEPSLHETDWYHRSIETNKDHRNEMKQVQLISNKHLSRMEFDQQQANLIENNRQVSNDKKLNLLPKKSSSHSDESLTDRFNAKTRTGSHKAEETQMNRKGNKVYSTQQLPINQKRNSDHDIPENYSISDKKQQNTKERSKSLSTHVSSSSKQLSTVDQKKISQTNITHDAIESRTPSYVSQLTKASTSTSQQSKTSTRSSKTSSLPSDTREDDDRAPLQSNSTTTRSRMENRDPSLKTRQQVETPPSSSRYQQKSTYNPLPAQSETSINTSKRRDQSATSSQAPSNVSPTVSIDQSQQPIKDSSPSAKSNQKLYAQKSSLTDSHHSQLASKASVNSTRSETPSNQLNQTSTPNKLTPTDSALILNKENNPQRPKVYITDSTFNEYHLQPTTQNISCVSIQTTATKSDSDVHSTRKPIDHHENEHPFENKSLLSPDLTNKSRKNTPQSKSSDVRADASTISSTDKNNFLAKETSDIQNAARPAFDKLRPHYVPSPIEHKTSNIVTEVVDDYQDIASRQGGTSADESLTQKLSNIQSVTRSIIAQETKSTQSSIGSPSTSNISTKTGRSSMSSLPARNPSLSQDVSYIKHRITSQNPSTNKLSEVDHMSTVYEESEPSSISVPQPIVSSLRKQDPFETNPSQATIPRNPKIKSSSKERSLSSILSPKSSRGSNHSKKTIDAKSISKSNTSIDYEFRIQTGNESQLDGTKESISIELINPKCHSIKVLLKSSINNSKPFQKGQLDIFHLNIPKNFYPIAKVNLICPKTTKDPLHIRYCELQDRQTMNTLYFPVEKWLGKNGAYNVEMHLSES